MSDLSLEERWQKYFFERRRDIKHLQSRGFCLDIQLEDETRAMSEGGFDPVKVMLGAHRDANRARKRITHWRVNRAAVYAIAAHPITTQGSSSKPILEREFLGIPLQLNREDCSDEPRLEAVFETYGRHGTLIHDYKGPIFHGNDKARLLAARAAHLTLADETRLVDGDD